MFVINVCFFLQINPDFEVKELEELKELSESKLHDLKEQIVSTTSKPDIPSEIAKAN